MIPPAMGLLLLAVLGCGNCDAQPEPLATADAADASAARSARAAWRQRQLAIWGEGNVGLREGAARDIVGLSDASAATPEREVARGQIDAQFTERGRALAEAMTTRMLATLRDDGGPDVLVFDFDAPGQGSTETILVAVVVADPSSPVDWKKKSPRDLARLLTELPDEGPMVWSSNAVRVAPPYRLGWRAYVADYDPVWDGTRLSVDDAEKRCEQALLYSAELDAKILPRKTLRDELGLRPPTIGPTRVTWDSAYGIGDKMWKYRCHLEAGAEPTITF